VGKYERFLKVESDSCSIATAKNAPLQSAVLLQIVFDQLLLEFTSFQTQELWIYGLMLDALYLAETAASGLRQGDFRPPHHSTIHFPSPLSCSFAQPTAPEAICIMINKQLICDPIEYDVALRWRSLNK